MKYLILASLLLIGCGSESTTISVTPQVEYVDDNYTNIRMTEHVDMCIELPKSIFCVNSDSIGDVHPTKQYVMGLALELADNSIYKATVEWYYNDTVYEDLEGDCEDTTMTLIQHMVDEGVDKKHLSLAYQLTGAGDTAHMFVAVNTVDFGMIHLDYPSSGYPIERINYHMKMTDVGIDKWEKGDIK